MIAFLQMQHDAVVAAAIACGLGALGCAWWLGYELGLYTGRHAGNRAADRHR